MKHKYNKLSCLYVYFLMQEYTARRKMVGCVVYVDARTSLAGAQLLAMIRKHAFQQRISTT